MCVSTSLFIIYPSLSCTIGASLWLSGKQSACNAGNLDSIPGLGRTPEGWRTIVHRQSCKESNMTEATQHAHARSCTLCTSFLCHLQLIVLGFPGGSVVKNSLANAGDDSLIPGSGRSPGEENGNPLQYSCLGNPKDRRSWQATVHGVIKELDTTQRLNNSDSHLHMALFF